MLMVRWRQRTLRWAAASAAAFLAMGSAVAVAYEGTADDYAQISQLMTKYSYTLDNRDAQGWASVFTEDGVFRDVHLCLIGRKQIAGFIDNLNGGSTQKPPYQRKPLDRVSRPQHCDCA